jgi:hypothetical protein
VNDSVSSIVHFYPSTCVITFTVADAELEILIQGSSLVQKSIPAVLHGSIFNPAPDKKITKGEIKFMSSFLMVFYCMIVHPIT